MMHVTDETAPRLVGIDADHNICFSVHGATAWLQLRSAVREYSLWEADPTAAEETFVMNDATVPEYGSAAYWRQKRLQIEAPEGASASIQ
eukprot:scaffold102701_cov43-Prasinocladus_malaysianus.AAC.1